MKKTLPILFLIITSLNSVSYPTITPLHKTQVQNLVYQVQFLDQQDISQHQILRILKKKLMNEKLLCSSNCEHDSNTLIECLIFMALGAGITYLIMDQKLKEEKAKNPVHVIRQMFQ